VTAAIADEIARLRGTKPATFWSLLRHPSYSRLWRAMLVSSTGDWVGFVAVTALVTRLGGGQAGFAVAGVMLARLLPAVLFGPFAGVLVDRFDRKRLMILADVTRGVGYASMGFLQNLPAIYALSFGIECMSLLWSPARDAIVPNLVPRRQLGNANSVSLLTAYGTLPLGGIIFTALAGISAAIGAGVSYIDVNREAIALWLDGLTFAFSAYMVWGLDLRRGAGRRPGKRRSTTAWQDLVEGVRFLQGHAFQRAMTVGITLAFAGVGSVIAVGPIFAERTLDAGSSGWGLLVTSVGIGLGIGMASLGWLSRVIEKQVLFPLALLAAAGTAIVLAVMPSITLAALLTVAMGIGAGAAWVTGYTLLQENIADEFRGRTFGTLTLLARFGILLSLTGFPLLVEAVGDHSIAVGDQIFDLAGTRIALWAGAAVVLAGAFFARRGLKRSHLFRRLPLSLRPQLRKMERRGEFIVFEGGEGSGKGTQIRLAREFLEKEGHDVLVTREPGGTELGERLRQTLLDGKLQHVDARAEALLFAASRAQHVVSVIRPALEEGKVVLCDRYLDSSIAYQGAGRGLGEHDVLTLNTWATQGLFPDLVILLHLDPEQGLARAEGEADRIESEEGAFHDRVAEAYLHIADEHPERVVVIDAADPPEVVHERVRAALKRYLKGEDGA
jgi:dTMP kinase